MYLAHRCLKGEWVEGEPWVFPASAAQGCSVESMARVPLGEQLPSSWAALLNRGHSPSPLLKAHLLPDCQLSRPYTQVLGSRSVSLDRKQLPSHRAPDVTPAAGAGPRGEGVMSFCHLLSPVTAAFSRHSWRLQDPHYPIRTFSLFFVATWPPSGLCPGAIPFTAPLPFNAFPLEKSELSTWEKVCLPPRRSAQKLPSLSSITKLNCDSHCGLWREKLWRAKVSHSGVTADYTRWGVHQLCHPRAPPWAQTTDLDKWVGQVVNMVFFLFWFFLLCICVCVCNITRSFDIHICSEMITKVKDIDLAPVTCHLP